MVVDAAWMTDAAVTSTGRNLVLKGWTCAMAVAFSIELEQEVDGRWNAEVVELPGVMA